eukprot:CAMPEP_0181322632 /NCGR_PEP_ID=MMETSP1101-20121128/19332_1 /TAXON_ID=46948 /ORGANISM="Rhodomonas abbreviata, Strain Caron Lab Isolate" /LENGTH=217 /DNA_ID=CAMNT_0023430559 /DNA_START=385 /DNA_END=1038 /DNA_ORIENTATION=+
MKGDGMFSNLRHKSKGLAVGLALAFGLVAPRKADAAYVAADGTFYEQSSPAPNFAAMGLSAGAAAATFAGGCAVAIKKERKVLEDDIEMIGKEITRLDSFKQEFLDGVPSDGSLLDSLNKALKGGPAAVVEDDEEEDEFEKNVRAFLEEEEKKDEKKGQGHGKAPSTLLERPSDVDGSEVDAWMNDVVFEDKPAEIDAEQLERLQRMFGGGPEAAGK